MKKTTLAAANKKIGLITNPEIAKPATGKQVAPPKPIAPVAAAKKTEPAGEEKIVKSMTSAKKTEPAGEEKIAKSMTAAFVPSEKLDKTDKTKLKVDRKNEARPGTARHTAIEAAQACKTMGELRGKLAANWISWLVREKYVVAAD